MRLRCALVVFLAASVLLASSLRAQAHEGTPAVADVVSDAPVAQRAEAAAPAPILAQAASGLPAYPWVVTSIVVALLGLSRCRRWRTFAPAVASLLVLLAFESGVHSVHHLGHAEASATCAVASAANHVAGVDAATPSAYYIPSPSFERVVLPVQSNPEVDPPAAHQGRAPPLAV